MNIRFVTWIIHNKNHIKPQIELLHKIGGDLVALQEVTVSAYQELVESNLYFAVSEVRYFYEEALKAGSDHALVVADLIHA